MAKKSIRKPARTLARVAKRVKQVGKAAARAARPAKRVYFFGGGKADGSRGMRDTLGWIYYQRELASPALRHFERAIALEPKVALYHYHLGLAHRLSGDSDSSRRALEAALRLEPGFTDAAKALQQNRASDAARASSPD